MSLPDHVFAPRHVNLIVLVAGNRIPKTLRAPLYIGAIISTFTSIVGFVGFIGSLCKKKALIRTFWVILCANLGIQIASSVYYLITFFRIRRASEKACLKFRPGTIYSDEWRYCDALDQLKRVNPVVIVIGAIVPLFVTGCTFADHFTSTIDVELTLRCEDRRGLHCAPVRAAPR